MLPALTTVAKLLFALQKAFFLDKFGLITMHIIKANWLI